MHNLDLASWVVAVIFVLVPFIIGVIGTYWVFQDDITFGRDMKQVLEDEEEYSKQRRDRLVYDWERKGVLH